jgi:RNA recognition motif-containing protein
VSKKLFVGNLSYSVDGAALRALFEQHGQVDSADVVTDRSTGQSKGFGFVEMADDGEAQAAIEGLNGVKHGGRTLNVSEARSRDDRGGAGGRGGAGRSRF